MLVEPKRLAAILAVVATLAAVLLPLAVIGRAVAGGPDIAALGPLPPGTVLSAGERWACIALGLPGLVASVWALLGARRLFGLYAADRALTVEAARTVTRIGAAVALIAVLGVLTPTLQILVVTWDNPPGLRQLSVAIGSDTVALLLAGGLLVLVGDATRRAAAQRAELDGFV